MNQKQKIVIILSFILLGVLSRLLPHPPNFTPIGAMALLGGVYLKDKKLAFLLPLAILFISDLLISGMHSLMPFVYLSFILITSLGIWAKENLKLGKLVSITFLSSLIFFIVSNLGVWWLGYEHSLQGLSLCFTLALPFFGNTLLGDFFFVTLFFGSFSWIDNKLKLNARGE
jgi:hypothetical protein